VEQVIRNGALARAMKIPPSIALLVGDLPMRGEDDAAKAADVGLAIDESANGSLKAGDVLCV